MGLPSFDPDPQEVERLKANKPPEPAKPPGLRFQPPRPARKAAPAPAPALPPDARAHNAEVERRKRIKLAAKLQRRAERNQR